MVINRKKSIRNIQSACSKTTLAGYLATMRADYGPVLLQTTKHRNAAKTALRTPHQFQLSALKRRYMLASAPRSSPAKPYIPVKQTSGSGNAFRSAIRGVMAIEKDRSLGSSPI